MKKTLVSFFCVALCTVPACAFAQAPSGGRAKGGASKAAVAARSGESPAEILYDQMVASWHKAKSIYYESACRFDVQGHSVQYSYKVWLKKPNYERLEVYLNGKSIGTVVSDGSNLCVYRHGGPPDGYAYESQKSSGGGEAADAQPAVSYITQPAPAGRHSIAEQAVRFGLCPVLIAEPSMFSGTPDPNQSYIDSGSISGVETVGSEKCDVLVLNCSKISGTMTFWLSRADHLPRKARVAASSREGQITIAEDWSGFRLNGEVADDKFAWAPQADWGKVRKTTLEDALLEPGTVAPGFTLDGANGAKISLADYKGKVVWLHIWMAG